MSELGFDYWNLDGRMHFGLLNYTRDLQEYALHLEKLVRQKNKLLNEKETQLAMSGEAHYLHDAKVYTEKYHNLCRENGELQGKVNALIIENAYLKKITKGIKPERLVNRDENGRILPPDGIGKDDKRRLAYLYRDAGMKDQEIAEKLGVSVGTVNTYCSEYGKKAEREKAEKEAGNEDPWWQKYL